MMAIDNATLVDMAWNNVKSELNWILHMYLLCCEHEQVMEHDQFESIEKAIKYFMLEIEQIIYTNDK